MDVPVPQILRGAHLFARLRAAKDFLRDVERGRPKARYLEKDRFELVCGDICEESGYEGEDDGHALTFSCVYSEAVNAQRPQIIRVFYKPGLYILRSRVEANSIDIMSARCTDITTMKEEDALSQPKQFAVLQLISIVEVDYDVIRRPAVVVEVL